MGCSNSRCAGGGGQGDVKFDEVKRSVELTDEEVHERMEMVSIFSEGVV